jgi:hypothetical protein
MFEKFLARFTYEQRLLYSIMYGWGVILFFVAMNPLWSFATKGGNLGELVMLGVWGAAIFLSIRYSLIGSVLHVAAEGAKVVGISYFLGLIFDRRNSGNIAFGALLGALFVMVIVVAINGIRSFYYLVKETYTYFVLKKGKTEGYQSSPAKGMVNDSGRSYANERSEKSSFKPSLSKGLPVSKPDDLQFTKPTQNEKVKTKEIV